MTEPGKREQLSQSRDYFNTTVSGLEHGYCAYRWAATPMRREHYLQTREALSRAMDGRRFKTLIEVGPGACIWTPLFAPHAENIVAVDLSWAMLQDGRRTAGPWKLTCGDAGALPLRSASADALCSSRAFEYFPDPDAAVAEFRRVLRPDGFLLLVTKNRDYRGYRRSARAQSDASASTKADVHSGNLSPDEVAALFASHGFRDIRLRPAVIGRSRVIVLWSLIRRLRRTMDPAWAALPRWIADASESVMLTASAPGRAR